MKDIKELFLYRKMSSLLETTGLVGNLILFRKSYINENYRNGKYVGGLGGKYGNNLHTSQSIELLRELVVWSGDTKNASSEYVLRTLINTYTNYKKPLIRRKLRKSKNLKRDIFFSLIHKQFWYQIIEGNLFFYLDFYFNYYDNNYGVDDYIKGKFGVTYKKLLAIFYILFESYKKNFYLDFYSIDNVYKDELGMIVKNFSIKLSKLKELLTIENNKCDKFNKITDVEHYGLMDLFTYPLIEIEDKFICPVPILLLNRVTNFIYYDFAKINLGIENQSFILKIIKRNLDKKYRLIDTNDFQDDFSGKNKPRNPDIIIEDDNNCIFIECKSNSLSYESIKNGITDKDKKRIKEYIIQSYEAVAYYNNLNIGDSYFGVKKGTKKILAIISYMKDPNLNFGNYEDELLMEILQEGTLDKCLVEENILLIMDNITIPYLILLLNQIGITKFIEEISLEEYEGWGTMGIVDNIYKKYQLKNDFKFEKTLIEYLEKEIKVGS